MPPISNPQLDSMRRYYQGLPANDQKSLRYLGIFLITISLIYLAIIPAHNYLIEQQNQANKSRNLKVWVENQAPTVSNISKESSESLTKGSLLNLVSDTAKSNNIDIKRVEPGQENELRIWLDLADFNNVINWLEAIDKKGVDVSNISADKAEEIGKASFNITLKI